MIGIKAARRFIEHDPADPDANVLADLVLALEGELSFPLAELYTLMPNQFALALEILKEWRLDRFYIGKAKLFDTSWQHREMRGTPSRPGASTAAIEAPRPV